MSTTDTETSAQVIPLHPSVKTTMKESEKKWGAKVMKLGYSIVPSLLFRAQRRLHLSPTDLAVLMQLADYWWDAARKPYPGVKGLGDRLNLSPRQVRRVIARLEAEKLVKRVERKALHGGKLTNTYDLSGLVARLQEIEPDFRRVEDETKSRRKAVSRPGFRQRPRAPE